jgi:putative PEP-CTERM system integral membrane protein
MNIKQKILPASQYFLFWSWNLIFILLIAFLLAEQIIVPITTSMIKGATPVEQGLFALFIFIVPFMAVGIGVSKGFRSQPKRLITFFFGIELPLFFLAIARLIITSELQAATLFVILVTAVGIVAFSYQLFSQQQHKTITQHLAEFGSLVFSLLIGIYIGALLIIISVPLLAGVVIGLSESHWLRIMIESPMSLLIGVFFSYTLTLFIGLPVMLCVLYTHAFWKKYRQTVRLFGYRLPLAVVTLLVTLNGAIFYLSNRQPQARMSALLEQPINNDQQRQALLTQQDQIRAGLLNAYLKDFRYAATTTDVNFIENIYKEVFHLERDGLPKTMQKVFNTIAAPFLFDDSDNSDDKRHYDNQNIAQRYADFFDAPIEKVERVAIRAALKSDWRRTGFEAGLIDANSEKVWIERQSVQVTESKHSALITIQETYLNRTFNQQEILYHFSLPTEAALTGVWLSDDAANLKKYSYSVAPRGAAQKLYKQEVQRRIDPALLEQVGPYQYRLRVFPIPARTDIPRTSIKTEVKPLYLQLQYVTPLSDNQQWPLPTLLEKRNAYWNADTILSINGKIISRAADQWLPSTLAAQQATPLRQQTLYIPDKNGQAHVIDVRKSVGQIASPTNKRYAFLIDTSYSMHQHKEALKSLLSALQVNNKSSTTAYDYFLVGKSLQATKEVKVDDIVFFGHSGHLSQLNLWQQSNPATHYDAIVLVTDEGAYELKETIKLQPSPNTPLWLLHLGDTLPYAYDDALLDRLLESKGGVATQFDTIVQQTEQTDSTIFLSGQYQWQYQGRSALSKEASDPLLIPIAAKQFIQYQYRQHKTHGLKTLDALHAIAIQHSIVTPFSSMIVVVNDQQQEDLKKLAGEKDRFDRQVEEGRKLSNSPARAFIAEGVPEPEEWALIIVLCLILFSAYVRKRKLAFTD